jgi:hypothetical protein
MDHPAPAELQPCAVRAADVELGRGFGEGEVRGTEPRTEVRAEERLGEGLDRAREVREGDAAVHDQTFELVEDGHVGGVGGVPPEHPPGHDGVDRRRLLLHHPDLHRRRMGA